MAHQVFRDRAHAGKVLARMLAGFANRPDVLVLALPRGGVPVAYEVAAALRRAARRLPRAQARRAGPRGARHGRDRHRRRAASSTTSVVAPLNLPAECIEAVAARGAARAASAASSTTAATARRPTCAAARSSWSTTGWPPARRCWRPLLRAARQRAGADRRRRAGRRPRRCEDLRAVVDEVVCAATPRAVLRRRPLVRGLLADDRRRGPRVAACRSEAAPSAGAGVRPDGAVRRPAICGRSRRPRRRTTTTLLELVGEARFVLIGEASHGTHEFYRERARDHQAPDRARSGFTAVAVEADWPDAYRVNRFVRGGERRRDRGGGARAASERFPTWMWRNADVLDFVAWLREHNDALAAATPTGRLLRPRPLQPARSMEAVIALPRRVDPRGRAAGARALRLLRPLRRRPAGLRLRGRHRRRGAVRGARSVQPARRAAAPWRAGYAGRDGRIAEDEFFYAEQNARLVSNAEEYYRAMFRGGVSSWNLRDRHMAETLDALVAHLERTGGPAEGRRVGAQLAPRRCARHRDGAGRAS